MRMVGRPDEVFGGVGMRPDIVVKRDSKVVAVAGQPPVTRLQRDTLPARSRTRTQLGTRCSASLRWNAIKAHGWRRTRANWAAATPEVESRAFSVIRTQP